MKIVGIFSSLTLDSKCSVDLHTRLYVVSTAKRRIEWSIILFSKSGSKAEGALPPGHLRVVHASRSFVVHALKSARDICIWLVSGWKVGLLKRMSAEVERMNPDILLFDGLPFAPLVMAFGGRPAVLACIDAASHRQYRLLAQARSPWSCINHAVRAISCEVLERLFLARFTVVHVVSEVDAANLRKLCPKANVRVIPIITPVAAQATMPASRKNRSQYVIWGDVGVPYIRDGLIKFLNTVPALLGTNMPQFIVVGRSAPDRSLKRILDKHPNVTFREWVPDMNILLAQSGAVLLVDDSGTGLKTRALHAMALGTVVIGTPITLEGIPVEDGKNAFICSSAAAFAAAIGKVQTGSREIAEMEEATLRFVEGHYSEQLVAGQWQALFREAVEGRS
jgi:glycosyltransferase involved in cell wall biosynthesis